MTGNPKKFKYQYNFYRLLALCKLLNNNADYHTFGGDVYSSKTLFIISSISYFMTTQQRI